MRTFASIAILALALPLSGCIGSESSADEGLEPRPTDPGGSPNNDGLAHASRQANGTHTFTLTAVETPTTDAYLSGGCLFVDETELQRVVRGNFTASWPQGQTSTTLELIVSSPNAGRWTQSGASPLSLHMEDLDVSDALYFGVRPLEPGAAYNVEVEMTWEIVYDGAEQLGYETVNC